MRRKRVTMFWVALVATVVCCTAGLSAVAAAAETTTPSTAPDATTQVSDDTGATSAEQLVTFLGVVIQALGGNEYVIQGTDGTITIDGGPFWYKVLNLLVGQTVSVTGELDTGKDGNSAAEVDVFTVADDKGTVIATVREGSGRPPWAGGPSKNAQHPGNTGAQDDADESEAQPDTD
jgi:uncharacterized protein YdeI (BOF family)